MGDLRTLSMLTDYIQEFTGKSLITDETGFAVYSISDKDIILENIYIRPEHRRQKKTHQFTDLVAAAGKRHGCTHIVGMVDVTAKNCTRSLKVILNYGFELSHINNNIIVFRKDI